MAKRKEKTENIEEKKPGKPSAKSTEKPSARKTAAKKSVTRKSAAKKSATESKSKTAKPPSLNRSAYLSAVM